MFNDIIQIVVPHFITVTYLHITWNEKNNADAMIENSDDYM